MAVTNGHERGMLGIAIANTENENKSKPIYVFLYSTESSDNEDGEDDCHLANSQCIPDYDPKRNRLYRYELEDNKLVRPKLLLSLPSTPGPGHNGGAIIIGPDNIVYIPIGDVDGSHSGSKQWETAAQNYQNGEEPDGRGGILRITQDGHPLPNGAIIGKEYPLNLYYAYGIRNSFGIDFDPVTGNMWATENGRNCCDEINLVEPGFNSGWKEVQGIWAYSIADDKIRGITVDPSDRLVNFGGKGKYSPPAFIWNQTVGPTALKFFNSDKYGREYENDLFVASTLALFHFDLNQNRTGLVLDKPLTDKIANNHDELHRVTLANSITITDMEIGPDGYLYILSYDHAQASIYRIVLERS